MKFKTALILFGVVVVLCGAILLFESAGQKKHEAEDKTQILIDLKAADVRKVSFVRNGEALTLERDEAGPCPSC